MDIIYQNEKIGCITNEIIKFKSGEEFEISKIKKAEYKSDSSMMWVWCFGMIFLPAVSGLFGVMVAMIIIALTSFNAKFGKICLYNKNDAVVFSRECNIYSSKEYKRISIVINNIITNNH